MKVISAGLLTHLQQDTTTLATCVKVTRRDGVVMGYTTHDAPLTFDCDGLGALTYQPRGGYNRSAIESQLGLSPDNLELEGLIQDDAITEEDLLLGVYDAAELKCMLVNWADLAQGVLKLRRGYIGRLTVHRDTYLAEVRGLMDAYSMVIGELYTPDCRADLGDQRCTVDLTPAAWQANHVYALEALVRAAAGSHDTRQFRCTQAGTSGGTAPAWDGTLEAMTTDGGVVWTTELAYTVPCSVSAVTGPEPGEPNAYRFTVTPALSEFGAESADLLPWFAMGKVTWVTGDNAGSAWEIKAWDAASATVTLFLAPPYPLTVGDTLTLMVGCDKRRQTCTQRFANIVNMRGEPYLPGVDKALAYPSAHGV